MACACVSVNETNKSGYKIDRKQYQSIRREMWHVLRQDAGTYSLPQVYDDRAISFPILRDSIQSSALDGHRRNTGHKQSNEDNSRLEISQSTK